MVIQVRVVLRDCLLFLIWIVYIDLFSWEGRE